MSGSQTLKKEGNESFRWPKLSEVDPLCAVSNGSSAVVAMSGGVDSSVAALLLAHEGWSIFGVSMQVWDYKNNNACNSKATCCSPADFGDARKVAGKIGVPYYVFDFEETFKRDVIDKFVETYREGRTPNPCVDCNTKIKFRELRERAGAIGTSHVATGHYARIRKSDRGFHLLRGRDLDKDQSYFLYTSKQEELSRTLFPVGHFTKAEVREIARSAGLNTADKKESQDICFISGSVSDFITRIGGVAKRRGEIVTKQGVKVGEHDGIHSFTVGQRRGLNIGGSADPLYIVEIDEKSNKVIVGSKEDLKRESFEVGECCWVSPDLSLAVSTGTYPFEKEVIAQVRSRHQGVKAKIVVKAPNRCTVHWIDDWATISPGQAAVFYDLGNEEVLGGGRIV